MFALHSTCFLPLVTWFRRFLVDVLLRLKLRKGSGNVQVWDLSRVRGLGAHSSSLVTWGDSGCCFCFCFCSVFFFFRKVKELGKAKPKRIWSLRPFNRKVFTLLIAWSLYGWGWEGHQIWSIETEIQTIKTIPKALKWTLERPNVLSMVPTQSLRLTTNCHNSVIPASPWVSPKSSLPLSFKGGHVTTLSHIKLGNLYVTYPMEFTFWLRAQCDTYIQQRK